MFSVRYGYSGVVIQRGWPIRPLLIDVGVLVWHCCYGALQQATVDAAVVLLAAAATCATLAAVPTAEM
jgi:hypothetical protein